MWAWMCDTAVWEDTRIRFNGQMMGLQRGQLITTIRFLVNGFGLGFQVTRTLLETLELEGMINTQTNTRGTIITICNYEKYQQGEETKITPSITRPSHAHHTPNTNNKQLNNINNLNKESIISDFEEFWRICPRKVGRGKAEEKYKIARRNADKETIETAMKLHAKEMKGKDTEFIPHPATWLHQKRYLDETSALTSEIEKKEWPQWKHKIAAHLGDHVVKGWFNTAKFQDGRIVFAKPFEFNHVRQHHAATLSHMGIKEIIME